MIRDQQIRKWIAVIDEALVHHFAQKDPASHPLEEAMAYTLSAGGKRLRPLLTLLVYAEFHDEPERAIPMALAAELLHTYSLIHDDLPCMDNDDLRRGKPTNHRVYGEANAVLAGDALHTEAFSLLATAPCEGLRPEHRLTIIAELGTAVGRYGMVAGQVLDLAGEGQSLSKDQLELLHRRKTGALLRFCVRLGGYLAGVESRIMDHLTQYAEAVGLLFQVVDDLLDEESNSEKLGKTVGKDAHQDKATYPKLMGAREAHAYGDHLLEEATTALAPLTLRTDRLARIARYIRHREY